MSDRGKKIYTIVLQVFLTVLVSAALLLYIFYHDLKKTFIARVSDRVSVLIGQPLDIGDISVSLVQGFAIADVRVRNPDGFPPGLLFAVKEISLDVDWRALLKGNIHFRKIVLSSPALTILKDPRGKSNISDGLIRFLSKKGTTAYRIDELKLVSGFVDFSNDPLLRNDGITLTVKHLSSFPRTKTLIEGATLWAGVNKVQVEGWATPGDEQKKFGISVSAPDLNFSPFTEFLSKHHIDAGKLRGGLFINAEGDTGTGVAFSSSVQVKSPAAFYRKKLLDIRMEAEAFYDIPSHSAELRTLALKIGNAQVLSAKGRIRDLPDSPDYDLIAKVEHMDLSEFDIMKGVALSGVVTSDALRVMGKGTNSLPNLTGSLRLKNGSVGSKDYEARDIDVSMTFSPGKEMSADTDISASLVNLAGHLLRKPLDARLSLSVRGQRRNVAFSADLTAAPSVIKIDRDRDVSLGDLRVLLDGTLRGKIFSGKSSFRLSTIKYKDHLLKGLRGAFGIGYDSPALSIESPGIRTDIFSIEAGSIGVKTLGASEGLLIEARGVNATYPPEKAALKELAVSGVLHTSPSMSGDFDFSLAEAIFRGAAANGISGKANFSDRRFSLNLPRAGIAGGSVTIAAEGLTSGGPFPLKAEVNAKQLHLGELARLFMKEKTGYRLTGSIEKAAFSGTIDSAESVHGKLTIDLRTLSLLDEKTKRQPLKGASVRSAADCQGDICRFTSDASAGKVEATFAGTAKDFLREGRSVHLQGHLAEVTAAEIRNAFWDAFPDALLYAGMEGSLSSDLSVDYKKGDISAEGDLRLREFVLTGENGEYSVGPVNGDVPISYGYPGGDGESQEMPAFERSDFDSLKKSYGGEFRGEGYRKITAGSLRYGFRLLDDITLWMKQEKGVLEIGRFSANIFDGRLNGSAVADFSRGLHYRAGMVLEGLSLTRLCEDIEPIRGYISGRVDGVGVVKGSGAGLQGLLGKADFWTYSTKEEKTKISREFLQKIGGTSLKSYMGDRSFDKGDMSLYLQKGFVVFRELEISNKNFFGMQDLSVKVAPLSNKISLEDLMWSIVEAAGRAGKNAQ